ncbi:MAG: histidine--tRNA ligase, partial [Bacilli bacterium]|nr:histidine--tRNA ligase [Bacilli bacterium]
SLDINYDVVMVNVIYDIFKKINIADFLIRINNRKLLIGFLELNNINNTDEVLRIIDKVSKVDKNSFIDLLKEVGLNDDQINKVINFIMFEGSNQDKLEFVTTFLGKMLNNDLGFEELKTVIKQY